MIESKKKLIKPKVLQPIFSNIPGALTRRNAWVVWRLEYDKRRKAWTKVPYDARYNIGDYRKAESDNKATWTTFEIAKKTYLRGGYDGVGFVLSSEDGQITGGDIDHCVSETGQLDHRAKVIVYDVVRSYAELSPSGKGVRFFCGGTCGRGHKSKVVELYPSGRFLTVTGHRLPDACPDVMFAQPAIDTIIESVFGAAPVEKSKPVTNAPPPDTGGMALEDARIVELLGRSDKGAALWSGSEDLLRGKVQKKANGDIDWSGADLALCCLLARYTRDPAQIDRLVCASGLYRDKWDRADYKSTTIEKALALVTVGYDPHLDSLLDWDTEVNSICSEAPEPAEGATDQPGKKSEAPKDEQGGDYTGYRFAPISAAAFDTTKYNKEWLIKRLLVAKEPAVLGGPKKSLKTSLLVDLALSLGSGSPFLGQFEVYKPRSVCVISGESGQATLQETARRVCKAKGIKLSDTSTFWDFRLPRLSVPEELGEMTTGLRRLGCEIVIIDPLYLCLLAGSQNKSAANVFDMGEVLADVGRACVDAGCLPILCHHARKNVAVPYAQMELEDLSQSGTQEFARQWFLVSRREPFAPGSGKHHLWLNVGGSSGQSGLWGIDIDEGELQEDFTGRTWDVRVTDLSTVKTEKAAEKEKKKVTEDEAEKAKFLEVLDRQPAPPTKTKIRNLLGWYQGKIDRHVTQLEERGVIMLVQELVTIGSGAQKESVVIKRRIP